MEIIDVLATYSDESAQFQVDTGAEYVSPTYPAGTNAGRLTTAEGKTQIQKGDNIILLSAGFLLPLSYEFHQWQQAAVEYLPYIYLGYRKDGTTSGNYEPTQIWLPYGNYEMNLGVYLEAPANVNTYYELFSPIVVARARISMLNVPASEHEKIYILPVYWKILHTLPLIPLP